MSNNQRKLLLLIITLSALELISEVKQNFAMYLSPDCAPILQFIK